MVLERCDHRTRLAAVHEPQPRQWLCPTSVACILTAGMQLAEAHTCACASVGLAESDLLGDVAVRVPCQLGLLHAMAVFLVQAALPFALTMPVQTHWCEPYSSKSTPKQPLT